MEKFSVMLYFKNVKIGKLECDNYEKALQKFEFIKDGLNNLEYNGYTLYLYCTIKNKKGEIIYVEREVKK